MYAMTYQDTSIIWLMLCAALVIFMQAGFCCLESGLVQSKNSINVAIKNLIDFCFASIIFWALGFALMFGPTHGGYIGSWGMPINEATSPTIGALFLFQLAFCGTATTILSGAAAERMKFAGYLITVGITAAVVYPIYGHWAWGGLFTKTPGWLESMGFIDFAGASVVHATGGWVALAAIIVIGPRSGRFGKNAKEIIGHNIPIAAVGALMLWFGWIGFNGGSVLNKTNLIPLVLMNSILSGSAGALVALGISWQIQKKPNVLEIINGTLGGLVAITACAHVVSPGSALLIGGVGGAIAYFGARLLVRYSLDDAVGAIPIHAFAGTWSVLAVALFAPEKASVLVQLTGAISCFVWAFGIGWLALTLINRLLPLRVHEDEEKRGLNLSEHGAETAVSNLLNEIRHLGQLENPTQTLNVDEYSEIAPVAKEYNRVLDSIARESKGRQDAMSAISKYADSIALLRDIAVTSNEAETPENILLQSLQKICVYGGWPIAHGYLLDEKGVIGRNDFWYLAGSKDRYENFKTITETANKQFLTVSDSRTKFHGLAGRSIAGTRRRSLARSQKSWASRRLCISYTGRTAHSCCFRIFLHQLKDQQTAL